MRTLGAVSFLAFVFIVSGLGMNATYADVVTIDGTVKAVDAKTRTITVETGSKTLTLDVSSKAKISVEGKEASLDTLKPGETVKLSYHDKLEVVLKIAVASNRQGQPHSPSALEATPLDELNFPAVNDVNPSLTSDGLQIFWQTPGEDVAAKEQWIYSARRKDPASRFTDKAKLFRGFNPVISAYGLHLHFYSPLTQSVNLATRTTASESFARPRIELRTKEAYPSGISSDSLTMYLDLKPFDRHSPAHVVSRDNLTAAWGRPTPIEVELAEEHFRVNSILSVSPVGESESAVLCIMNVEDHNEAQVRRGVLSRKNRRGRFTRWDDILLSDSTGRNAGYFAPRYVPATKELFVQSSDLYGDKGLIAKWKVDLWVIRNYEQPVLKDGGATIK
jgi:hypothetical protein